MDEKSISTHESVEELNISPDTVENAAANDDKREEAAIPENEINNGTEGDGEEPTDSEALPLPVEENTAMAYFTEDGGELVPLEKAALDIEEEYDEQIEFPLPDGEHTDSEEDSDDYEEQPESVEPDNEEQAIPEEQEEKKNEQKIRRIDTVFDFVELFIFTLVAVLVITSFFFRHSIVEGDSMNNTLIDKETLIITSFLYTPEQNDIIVFEDYGTGLRKPLVKRVIATEGQTVRVTKNGIIVDGVLLEEDYVFTDGIDYRYSTTPPTNSKLKLLDSFTYRPGEYYEFVVPENELFVLGDHRNESTDSRLLGTVSEDSVLGKVVLRIFPFAKFGAVE